jgi:hypothetical protein
MATRVLSAAVARADAQALVGTFFDALGHFAGESPALGELMRVLAPAAEISELSADRKESSAWVGSARCLARDAWLRSIVARADLRRHAGHGHFFEELKRAVVEKGDQLCVESVVEERLTEAGRVTSRTTLRCCLTVSKVGARPSITRVRVRRTTRARDEVA